MSGTGIWLFNIDPQNWEHCVEGPPDYQDHRDHVGHPWQGLQRKVSRQAANMHHGDIAFVHRTRPNDDAPTPSDGDLTPGTAAIWVIHSTEPVADQTLHNWPETYDQFIYCRALVREFDPPIDDLQFLRAYDFAQFKEGATPLDREYADLFLRNIREMADLPDEVDRQLRQAIDALERGDRAAADLTP